MKKTKENINYESIAAISKRYNESLIRSGYPSNTHVYELNPVYLEKGFPREEVMFLQKAKKFYSTLTFIEGVIFLNDYLEKGKNYPYWWLAYGNEDYINSERRKLECKLLSQLSHLLTK